MGMFSKDEDDWSYSDCSNCNYKEILLMIKDLIKIKEIEDDEDEEYEKLENEKHELMQRAIDLSCENNLLKQEIERLKNKNNNLQFESNNNL